MIFFSSTPMPQPLFDWIAVYSGEQPSMEDYFSNFETLYSFTGSNLLQIITVSQTTSSQYDENGNYSPAYGINIEPNTEGYAQGLYSIQAGEGTWAALQRANWNHPLSGISAGGVPVEDITDSYYQLTIADAQKLFLSYDNFYLRSTVTIVPISTLESNGVVKFNSTLFSHPDSDSEDAVLDLNIKIRQST